MSAGAPRRGADRLDEQMLDPGVGRESGKQQRAVAGGGVALEAEQGGRPILCKHEQHRAFGNRFWKLELVRIDAL